MTHRLEPQPLEWIDRRTTVSFELEGQVIKGFKGDVISSALWANNIRALGRSFKYHRRRGLLSMANHDINALYQSKDRPNVRGDVVEIEEGLTLTSVNTFGNLNKDAGSFVELIGKFLPVGFYYRAFYSPKFLFPKWESLIRHMAGLGKVDTQWTAERKSKKYHYCDVVVIGAGPSGMSAAIKAAEQGADVCLIDENVQIGGSLDYQYVNEIDQSSQRDSLKETIKNLPNITVFTSAYVAGLYGDNWLAVNTQQGLIKLSALSVVVATGVFEQPAVFRNNDLPGVMNASAAQRLIARYGVAPCQKAVVLTSNPEGYRAALDLYKVGIRVEAVFDTGLPDNTWYERVVELGIPVYSQIENIEALGKKSLTGVIFTVGGLKHQVECDGLLMSVGWAPAGAAIYQAGGKFSYNETLHQLLPLTMPEGLFVCGRVNGVFEIENQYLDGQQAGLNAYEYAKDIELTAGQDFRSKSAHSHDYPIWEHAKGKNFVDFDEDIQLKDLKAAVAQGFDNIELMKRFSTIGMGPSQGKHSNMNGIRILARQTGKTIDQTGSTTARPMFHPTPVSHLAGMRFRPERETAIHHFHVQAKAKFMEAGNWLRPEFYQTQTDRDKCILSEVMAVRTAAGLIDVSTLGKLEVFGSDAAELMDRLYTMTMSNMKIGASRYAVMVDDTGVVIDDGVAIRYTEQHYYVTTTTSGSDAIYRLVQQKIIQWGLDVTVLNRTGQLAAMNLAGPKSRLILSLLTDLDLSDESFPYLAMRETQVCGYDATLIRVGFVGEIGYEIHLDSKHAEEVWLAVMQAGKKYKIQPFGVEAQRLLRLEKGHIIIGQDTDGLMNPFEANMSWAVHFKKPYFIGKPSLQRLKSQQSRKLVGFELLANTFDELPLESNLIIESGEMVGRITSIAYSPSLKKTIGLADLSLPHTELDKTIHIKLTSGRLIKAKIISVPFYDPKGLKQVSEKKLEGDAA